jgi:phosphoribosylaminoimidazole carboxylase
MLTEAAHCMNIKIAELDSQDAPAKQINARHPHVDGSFTDPNAIRELARQCDILTVEIEHVNTEVLEEIAETGIEIARAGQITRRKVEVQPNWRTTYSRYPGKYLQKQHLHSLGVSTAESIPLSSNSAEAVSEAGETLGYPLMLKSRTHAYDGRGNFPVRSPSDIPAALKALGTRPLYAEKWIEFSRELAVMVVKTEDGFSGGDDFTWKRNTLAYPVVETVHEDSICKLVYAYPPHTPFVLPQSTRDAEVMARKAISGFWGKGIFGVELFLTDKSEPETLSTEPRTSTCGFLS